jgi:hypothetical protein
LNCFGKIGTTDSLISGDLKKRSRTCGSLKIQRTTTCWFFQSNFVPEYPWYLGQLQHTFVEKLNNFENFISTNKIFLKIQYFPSQIFVIWGKKKQLISKP